MNKRGNVELVILVAVLCFLTGGLAGAMISDEAWKSSVSTIAANNPAEVRSFLLTYNEALDIAGRYGEKKVWYIAEKNEDSIKIYKGGRGSKITSHVLHFPDDLYREDYRKLQEGGHVVFIYNNRHFDASVKNPAELLQPSMIEK